MPNRYLTLRAEHAIALALLTFALGCGAWLAYSTARTRPALSHLLLHRPCRHTHGLSLLPAPTPIQT
jgi:hypothetical protein